jgi:hypothetical protein
MEPTLQSLYEQQDYETLVKRTMALTDLNMIRFHVIGLLGLGAHAMVLKTMIQKFSLIQKALITFLKIHYEIARIDRQLIEHQGLLTKYDELPYISQEIDEKVQDIRRILNKPSQTNQKDTLALFLDAVQVQDLALLADLIPQLKPIHIFQVKQTIFELLRSTIPHHIKGLLVIALIDVKYDDVVTITRGQETYTFNPIDTVNPFMDGTFQAYQKQIDSLVKDPSVRHIAYALLTTYMMTQLPFAIDPEFYFFQALVMLAYDYLKLPGPQFDGDEGELELITQTKEALAQALLK